MTIDNANEINSNSAPVDCVTPDCGSPDCAVTEKCCGTGENVTFGKCQDWLDFTILGDRAENQGIELDCQARFLKIRICLKNVCKGRRLALGVMVCDAADFRVLGFKGREITVPGSTGSCCRSLNVSEFCFVIPETQMCRERRLKVNVIAHYTDLNPNPGGCPL